MDFKWKIELINQNNELNTLEHLHYDIELLYLLEGKINLFLEKTEYHLKKGDVILINSNKKHWWRSEGKVLLCCLRIDYSNLTEFLGKDIIYFWCNSMREKNEYYDFIRRSFHTILREYVLNSNHMSFLAQAEYYQLIDFLLKHFLIQNTGSYIIKDKEKIIYKIVQYIHRNYAKKISLQEISETFYLSASSVSRLFSREKGVSFVDYINELRLQFAIDDLLESEKTITQISMERGFSSLAIFSRVFKKNIGVSPIEYRRIHRDKYKDKIEINTTHSKEELSAFLKKVSDNEDDIIENLIECDCCIYSDYKKVWGHTVNVGMANQLAFSKNQEHMLLMKEKIGLYYCRVKNILSSSMHIRKDFTMSQLNFEKVNDVLDFFVENGLIPIINIGEEPRRIKNDKDHVVFFEEDDVFFNNENDAKKVLKSFIHHIVRRYGSTEVSKWIFEIVYDERTERIPEDITYDYVKMAAFIMKLIRKSIPEAIIGVFGHEIDFEKYCLFDFLKRWKGDEIEPDFVSLKIQPYYMKDMKYQIYSENNYISRELEKCRNMLNNFGYDKVKIFLTEWNGIESDRNYMNDTSFKGTMLIRNMLDSMEYADTVIYNYFSDITTTYYDKHQLLFGGRGLLSKDGLLKPVGYAMKFLNKMERFLIVKGEDYLITSDGKGNYAVLLCNYKRFGYKYYMCNEYEWDKTELDNLFEDNMVKKIQIKMSNIENSRYCIKRYKVGNDQANLLEEWIELGGGDIDTVEDIKYLDNITVPKITTVFAEIIDNRLEYEIEMSPHDIVFLHIYKDSVD